MVERELPKNWEWKRLGDVCRIRTGDKDVNEGNLNGIYPFFTCSQEIYRSNTYSFDCEAILVAGNGAVGETKYYSGKFEAYQRTYVLDSFKLLAPYVFLFLKFDLIKQLFKHVSGSTMPYIRKGDLENIKIPIPPQEIQCQIVSMLEQAEVVKRLRHEADELSGALLQSVFYEMFGDPVENEKGWKIKKLGDLGDWTSGGTPSRVRPEYFEGNIPWYSTGELNDSYLVDSVEHITQEGLDSSAAKIFPIGTMLIGMYDSAAFKMGILCHQSATNQACAAFSPRNELIDTLFALQLFKAMKPSFLSRRRGVRQKNLNQQIIKDFEVPLPPLVLQQQFARVVEEVERIREQQAESKREIDMLFEGLMKGAFSGDLVA